MSTQTHPRGLYLIFATGMAERFSYYGMRALFVLYLVAAFFDSATASQIYGSYTGLVYLTPLIGGYVADRFWGNNKSILFGGIAMAIGHFLLFASACTVQQTISVEGGAIDASVDNSLSLFFLFAGLAGIIIGNGFFKPNITTMVGDLYPRGDNRKDAAFTIFYMGINVGAFIAPIICGTLGEGSWNNLSPFKWGFFCAGLSMIVSLIIFVAFKKKYLVSPEGYQLGLAPSESELLKVRKAEEQAEAKIAEVEVRKNSPVRLWASVIGLVALFFLFTAVPDGFSGLTANDYISAVVYSFSIVLPIFIITDRSLTTREKKHIGVIYVMAVFVIFFWSAFEQAGSSLTIFADKNVDRMLGSFEFKTTWFQSVNPVVVVCFAPIMAALWSFLGRYGKEPSSLAKQALGLALLSIGYIVIAYATAGISDGAKISMFWLLALYFIHTLGELSLSPIGMSMVNQLSPARFATLLMGVWFTSNAASNILAGNLAALLPTGGEPKSFLGFEVASLNDFFILFAVMSGVAAIILFALCPLLKKMMK